LVQALVPWEEEPQALAVAEEEHGHQVASVGAPSLVLGAAASREESGDFSYQPLAAQPGGCCPLAVARSGTRVTPRPDSSVGRRVQRNHILGSRMVVRCPLGTTVSSKVCACRRALRLWPPGVAAGVAVSTRTARPPVPLLQLRFGFGSRSLAPIPAHERSRQPHVIDAASERARSRTPRR
jgi:hypothetical protein